MLFNVGGLEILVIIIVALIAVGPEQLPGVLRRAGRSAAKARALTANLRDEFMAGLDHEDVDSLRKLSSDPAEWLMGQGTDDDPVVPRQTRPVPHLVDSNDSNSGDLSDSKKVGHGDCDAGPEVNADV